MTALVLYGTSCCHLCEQAEAILHELEIVAEHVDIAEDDAMIESYGTRIPVLCCADSGAELGWPFDGEMVKRFLALP
jgi:glutaredoxin